LPLPSGETSAGAWVMRPGALTGHARRRRKARQALGARLREIRMDARLNGRQLAGLADWHFTKISRLEHGARLPSAEDIETPLILAYGRKRYQCFACLTALSGLREPLGCHS
jgi:hypothetical protein